MSNKKERVYKFLDEGLSVDEICVAVGCAPQYVYDARNSVKRQERLLRESFEAIGELNGDTVNDKSVCEIVVSKLSGVFESFTDEQKAQVRTVISGFDKQAGE